MYLAVVSGLSGLTGVNVPRAVKVVSDAELESVMQATVKEILTRQKAVLLKTVKVRKCLLAMIKKGYKADKWFS